MAILDTIQHVLNDLHRLRDELEAHRTDLPPYAPAVPLRYRPEDVEKNPLPSCAVANSLTYGREQLHDHLLVCCSRDVSSRAREVLAEVKTGYHSLDHHFRLCLRRNADDEDRQKLRQVYDDCYQAVEDALRFYVILAAEIEAAIKKAESNDSMSKEPPAPEHTVTSVAAEMEGTAPNKLGTPLEEVVQRLERLCDQGCAYTSQSTLATQIGCSPSTVNKAINVSPKLRTWMDASKRETPRAVGMNEIALDNTAQAREPDPAKGVADTVSDDEVETVMAHLIDIAQPEERAKLNALDSEGRRKLASLHLDQQANLEPSPLEDDPPGKPRKVQQHPRV